MSEAEIVVREEVSIETISLDPTDILVFRIKYVMTDNEMTRLHDYLWEKLPKGTHFVILNQDSVEITKVTQ